MQIVTYLIDAGFPPLQAATAWGFSGIVTVVGMLGISTLDYNPLIAFALVNVVLGMIPFLIVPALRR